MSNAETNIIPKSECIPPHPCLSANTIVHEHGDKLTPTFATFPQRTLSLENFWSNAYAMPMVPLMAHFT